MTIGIDDLDDDDILEPGQQEGIQEPPLNEPPHQDEEGDFMSDFLKTRGIDDLNSINFEDDNGEVIQRSWNDLSNEEKINILNMPLEEAHEDNGNDLTEEEVNLLTQIRQSNLSPQEYLQQIAGEQVEVTPQYKIDDLSDDEVYLLDLESRVGELSDEEAAQALSTAKSNEDFFKKQIEGIRKEYKEREDLQAQQEEAQREQEQQQAFEEYQAQVVDAINGFNSIGNFDLNFEDADREELAEFMLSRDQAGKNYLFEALSENQYKKGLEDGKKGVQTRPTVVIDNSNKNNNNKPVYRSYKSINDLDDDD